MKKCFKCGIEKELSEFYAHPRMGDGHLGKCKECTKNDTKIHEAKIKSTPEGIESERKRHREKYHRLKYKDVYKPTPEEKKEMMAKYDAKYPEKKIAKSHAGKIIAPEGFEKHHWSYNKVHWKDIFFLTNKNHNTAHRFIIYDQERMMYRTLTGELLDSRLSHEKYINQYIQ